MADSRYDDIKYFSDGEFKVPQEIKVFDNCLINFDIVLINSPNRKERVGLHTARD